MQRLTSSERFLNQEARKVERVVPNALLGPLPSACGASRSTSRFSCFPDYCQLYCPSGVVTSVPDGGLNSNVDGGIAARVWFEYVVTIRSPFGNSMSVRSTRNLSLIRRSSF